MCPLPGESGRAFRDQTAITLLMVCQDHRKPELTGSRFVQFLVRDVPLKTLSLLFDGGLDCVNGKQSPSRKT